MSKQEQQKPYYDTRWGRLHESHILIQFGYRQILKDVYHEIPFNINFQSNVLIGFPFPLFIGLEKIQSTLLTGASSGIFLYYANFYELYFYLHTT